MLLFLLTLFYSSLENDVSLPKEGGEGLGADLHRAEQISYQVRGFPYNSESGAPWIGKILCYKKYYYTNIKNI